jgi:hypothetical protein
MVLCISVGLSMGGEQAQSCLSMKVIPCKSQLYEERIFFYSHAARFAMTGRSIFLSLTVHQQQSRRERKKKKKTLGHIRIDIRPARQPQKLLTVEAESCME